MIMPGPVQAAMTAALSDDTHAAEQKARYAARRSVLAAGLTAAGFRIEHSEAGLYLWATRPGLDCWAACELLASECGILAGPGSFYGRGGKQPHPGRADRDRRAGRRRRRAAAGTRVPAERAACLAPEHLQGPPVPTAQRIAGLPGGNATDRRTARMTTLC